MKKIDSMARKLIFLWVAVFSAMILYGCDMELGGTESGRSIVDEDTLIDDVGNRIEIEKTYGRIVSLYEEHTENLFALGAGDSIIGVDRSSTYPFEATKLPRYSYESEHDLERIIESKPDLVLIAPEVNSSYPSFVTRLETAGLKVVSLRPDDFSEFDEYIEKLAMLTGRTDVFVGLLEEFYGSIEEVSSIASRAPRKAGVFFESSEQGYYTASVASLPQLAIEYANGKNVAESPEPLAPGEEESIFGLDSIIEAADDIEVYLTLRGVKSPGASRTSIYQKPEFEKVEALRNGRVYEMEEALIGSYTFRYAKGVKEVGRYLYPELFDDVKEMKDDRTLDRRSFSEIVFKLMHLPIYVNDSSTYYDFKRYNHLYGSFADVSWEDPDFDYIETATMRSYISGFRKAGSEEFFDRNTPVTRAEVAKFLYILLDLHMTEDHVEISDIGGEESENIIQIVVDNGYMTAENGEFNPGGTYTNVEFIDFMEGILEESTEG